MRSCYQFQTMTVLEHGYAVHDKFMELHDSLRKGRLPMGWKIPSWLTIESGKELLAKLPDLSILRNYQVYHDCGKPLCLEVDGEGRRHFPNHAQVSQRRWLECGGDASTAELIGADMLIHTISAEQVPEFLNQRYWAALLLTGLAEIHANAQMFGGIDSVSFKTKAKQLERRGRAVLKCHAQSPS